MDLNGKMVIPVQFGWTCDFFSEGLAAVSQNGKYGYIDNNGNFVIEPQFEYAFPFIRGVALVSIENEESVLINREGTVIVDLKDYDGINIESYFLNSDLLTVQSKDRFIYINRRSGEPVFEVAYKDGI